jgi:choline-sulfatase
MIAPTNLLILLSDNHSRALAGCYGDPQATTPNLDRI